MPFASVFALGSRLDPCKDKPPAHLVQWNPTKDLPDALAPIVFNKKTQGRLPVQLNGGFFPHRGKAGERFRRSLWCIGLSAVSGHGETRLGGKSLGSPFALPLNPILTPSCGFVG